MLQFGLKELKTGHCTTVRIKRTGDSGNIVLQFGLKELKTVGTLHYSLD